MRDSIPVLRVGTTLLVTVQTELKDTVADAFQEDLLLAIERNSADGLVVDISGLDMVDSYVARVLNDTGRMAKLMGIETVVVGMQPQVAATLVRMGFRMEGVGTGLDVDHGIRVLERIRRRRQ